MDRVAEAVKWVYSSIERRARRPGLRRPSRIFAAAVGVAVAVASPLESRAQQPPTQPNPAGPASSAASVSPGRTARHLLRNGQDFLKFRQFERALGLFQEAQQRQAELTPTEP